jgi:hypothetical protein
VDPDWPEKQFTSSFGRWGNAFPFGDFPQLLGITFGRVGGVAQAAVLGWISLAVVKLPFSPYDEPQNS